MPDNRIEVLISMGIDKAKAQEAIRALDSIAESSDNVKASATNAQKALAQSATAAAANAKSATAAMNASGGSARSFQRVGSAFNQLGLSGIGSPITGVGDLLAIKQKSGEVVQSLVKLGDEFKTLPSFLGATSTAASALVAPLGATAAGLTALAAPVIAIAAPIAAVVLATKAYDSAIQSGRDAISQAILANQTYYEVIRKGSQESIAASLKDRQDQLQDEKTQLAALKQAREASFKTAVDAFGGGAIGDIFGRLSVSFLEGKGAYTEVDTEVKRLEQSTQKAKGQMEGYNRALESNAIATRTAALHYLDFQNQQLDIAQKGLQAGKGTSESVKQQLIDIQAQRNLLQTTINSFAKGEQTTETGKRIEELVAESNKLAREYDNLTKNILPALEATEKFKEELNATFGIAEANKRIASLKAGREEQLKGEREAANRAQAEALMRAGIAAAKAAEQEQAYQDRLTAIRKDATARAAELQKHAGDEATKAAQKFAIDQRHIENDYAKSRLKALEDYQKSEAQALDKGAKDRRRLIEDAQSDLTDLAREGDVAGFISRDRQFDRDLKRLNEDADDETKARAAAFADRQKEDEQNYADQLKDLRENYDTQERERRDNLRTELDDLRKQADERLQQEKDAHEQRIAQSQRLEQEFADWQAQQDAAEKAAKAAREETDFQEKLRLETDRRDQLLQVSQGLWGGIEAQINALKARFALSDAVASAQNFASTKTSSNLSRIEGFASGLPFVPSDNFPALLHQGERVLTRDENLAYSIRGGVGASGGRVINLGGVNLGGITIGAGNAVTRDEVTQAVGAALEDFAHLVADIVEPTLKGDG